MKVHVPTPLRSYTGKQSLVDADGSTLAELLSDLDARYPGMRFRMIDEQDQIREHVRLFVNSELAQTLQVPLKQGDAIHIIMAISGG